MEKPLKCDRCGAEDGRAIRTSDDRLLCGKCVFKAFMEAQALIEKHRI